MELQGQKILCPMSQVYDDDEIANSGKDKEQS